MDIKPIKTEKEYEATAVYGGSAVCRMRLLQSTPIGMYSFYGTGLLGGTWAKKIPQRNTLRDFLEIKPDYCLMSFLVYRPCEVVISKIYMPLAS